MPLFTLFHRAGSGEALVLLHGFTDTWRSWELVLPALERRYDVLAPTLPGHAGGPPLPDETTAESYADAVEAILDEARIDTAHLAGNSLGGYLSLVLASRGRARSVVALAPAGGWAAGDESFREALEYFREMQKLLRTAAPQADRIVSTEAGRRRSTLYTVARFEHIPPELIAHQMVGAAACRAVGPLIEVALGEGWPLDAERVTCPVRIVWGTADRLLEWPRTAARYRALFPHADWVELDGVGHCPQLDVPAVAAELIGGFG